MNKKNMAVLLSALLVCGGVVSCNSSSSGSDKTPDVSDNTTEAEIFSETTTEVTSDHAAMTTTTKKKVPVVTTKPASDKEMTTSAETSGSGYTDSLTIASDFYQAYLEHDPEKVYKLFNEQEIECYKDLMADELDGESPDELFSQEALISAIDSSMVMIEEIMTEFSESENDRWTADVSDGILAEVTDEELSVFNEELGTDYTSGYVINYMYYVNADNGEVFVGNSSAFLEKNGQWYLSFSSLMQSELIDQLEI